MPQAELLTDVDLPSSLMAAIESAPMPSIFDAVSDAPMLLDALRSLTSPYAGRLVESALWLLAGELDRSHEISQNAGSAEGSFWHGIMHRREGDYSNAKYWFRQVGDHVAVKRLAKHIQSNAAELGESLDVTRLCDAHTLPSLLVDLCSAAREDAPETRAPLERICWWEWQFLLAESI